MEQHIGLAFLSADILCSKTKGGSVLLAEEVLSGGRASPYG